MLLPKGNMREKLLKVPFMIEINLKTNYKN